MNTKSVKEAKTQDFRFVQAALERAAQRARELAKQTNTPLVMSEQGKLVKLMVNE